jgi:hypothetical protein
MKALLATVNKSALAKYEPQAALGVTMTKIPKDHLLVLIAYVYAGLQNEASRRNEPLTKDILSSALTRTFNQYQCGKLEVKKKGNDYSVYEV